MRDLFLLDPHVVFLNHGSFGACPLEVMQAQFNWQLEVERNPVEFLARRSAGHLLQARNSLASLVGTTAEKLVFIPNSTTGVNMVARSLPLAPGDEVLSTDLEYGACDAAWQRICAQRGAHYRQVKIPLPFDRDQLVKKLFSEAGPRTRLIYVSHITSSTALTLPVKEICAEARARGIATLIDGAHAPGQIELDLDDVGADFYVGNCHKWLCAPKGTAFIHAAPAMQNLLDATVVSWGYAAGAAHNPLFNDSLGITPFERKLQWQGTRDLAAWLAVPAAIEFQAKHHWQAVRAQCHELARHAFETLTQRHGLEPISNDTDWAQMVAIPLPKQDANLLQQRLYEESRIEIPVTTHGEQVFVRISVQGYNTPEDIERLLAAPALK